MSGIIYLPAASKELQATIDWLADHASKGHANHLASVIESALFEIAEVPLAWPVSRLSSRVRARPLRAIHHTVFYLVEPVQVVVVAISHMKRRPGYWLDRVE
jgi:plasmid stabilization system protein ParE